MKENRGGARENAGRKKKFIDKRVSISIEEENSFIFEIKDKTKLINELLRKHKGNR